MDAPSPVRRRVLETLDGNASPRRRDTISKRQQSTDTSAALNSGSPNKSRGLPSPLRTRNGTTKTPTPASEWLGPRRKRLRSKQEGASEKRVFVDAPLSTCSCRSASPAASEVFDESHRASMGPDATQDTVVSLEDDHAAPAPAPRRGVLVGREETRRRVEKLRLRLGLASYKVRTGQTDLPLDRLAVVKQPARSLSRPRKRAHTTGTLVPPKLPPANNAHAKAETAVPPRRASFDEGCVMKGMDSPTRAGAVNGLLSLARS
ncbi:hypothetical protein MKZ38_010776 [Zalerion maritima]|uniref:Cyclin-dependent kinase n=1 Tax=Zalerion maritima TaxID=339359 RepID=A0AAD5RZL2_9PEZI|nr:hypothetical protein MKZ38_010776 [Zalerion maritima]